MDFAWVAGVSLFALTTAVTPGPNNTMVMASGANFGFARTLPHMLGIALGFAAMLLVLAFGGKAIVTDPTFQIVLKWAGIAYLLWLSWKIATATPRLPADSAAARSVERESRPFSFLQAAAFQWVNPKAWIIAAGAVASYALAGDLAQLLFMAAIFAVAAMLAVVLWTLLGVGAARFLGSLQAVRRFNMTMAALLVLSLIPVILE